MVQWKNFLIKGFVWVLQLFQRKGEHDRFLIVSTTGLGDTLWGTPAIRALRESYPSAYIGCLTSSLGAAVLKNNPHLNELFVFKKPHFLSLLKLYLQLRKKKIGVAILFHTSQRSILPLCASIGTFRRIGTEGLQKGLDDLLTDSVLWNVGHEIERRLDMIRVMGASVKTYEMDFFIGDDDRRVASELIPEEWVIGLHPGAKDRFKQWPVEHFVKVGQQLKEKLGCVVVVTGSLEEQSLVEVICRQIEGARAVIQPLAVMGGVLERLSLFITNDTGPLHLALAMKTPTIALFTPTDPRICGPYQNLSAKVIAAAPTCLPCLKKKCLDAFCMRQIGPEAVVAAALEKLGVFV